MGKRKEIQAGTWIFVGAARKHVDGTLQTPRITYGRMRARHAFGSQVLAICWKGALAPRRDEQHLKVPLEIERK
jgi:hypothetical protein